MVIDKVAKCFINGNVNKLRKGLIVGVTLSQYTI